MSLDGDIPTVFGKVERGIGLTVFTVAISKLANEVSFLPSLGPGFS